jgi:hypothetical protein
MTPPHHAVKFTLTKRKVIKKRITKTVVSESGIPRLEVVSPVVTKEAVDTNGITKLYQAMWEYYLRTKLKRISSEGSWRPGIGFIKNQNKGFADLHGLHNGIGFYIEVKRPTENHLKSQQKFSQWVESGGAYYLTALCFDDMYDIVQIILSNQLNLLGKYKALRVIKHRDAKGGLFD